MDRKHQFKVQNSGTPSKKDTKHFQAYKTELRGSEHLQQCQLSPISPPARWNSNKHLTFGIKCRKMSISPLSPEPHENLCILHGTGEPCPFSRNLEIDFNSSIYRLIDLKQGLCYFKNNQLVSTEKKPTLDFICVLNHLHIIYVCHRAEVSSIKKQCNLGHLTGFWNFAA